MIRLTLFALTNMLAPIQYKYTKFALIQNSTPNLIPLDHNELNCYKGIL